MILKLGSVLYNLTQLRFVEELESVSNSSEMILELHEMDLIKLDFDFEAVNTALNMYPCIQNQYLYLHDL